MRGGRGLSCSPPHWAWLKIKSWCQVHLQSSRATTQRESQHRGVMCGVQAKGSHSVAVVGSLGPAVEFSKTIRKLSSWFLSKPNSLKASPELPWALCTPGGTPQVTAN